MKNASRLERLAERHRVIDQNLVNEYHLVSKGKSEEEKKKLHEKYILLQKENWTEFSAASKRIKAEHGYQAQSTLKQAA